MVLHHVLDGSYAISALPSGAVPTLRKSRSSSSVEGGGGNGDENDVRLRVRVPKQRSTSPSLSSVGGGDKDDMLLIDDYSSTVTLDGHVHVILSDMHAGNGVLHAIDAVLLPDDVSAPAVAHDEATNGEDDYRGSVSTGTIALGDDSLGGTDDFLDASDPSRNDGPTDDFSHASFPLDDQHDVDDGGVLHDDGGEGAKMTDDALDGDHDTTVDDDFFNEFLGLDKFSDDTFPMRDDWYDDNVGVNIAP